MYKVAHNIFFRSCLRVMRGYYNLRNENKLYIIEKTKNLLSSTKFIIQKSRIYNNFFFHHSLKSFSLELSVRQFLVYHLIHRFSLHNPLIGFSKALLMYFGKNNKAISYPLPKFWRSILIETGYKINKFRSAFKWAILVLFFWSYGVLIFIKLLKYTFKSLKNTEANDEDILVFIKDLTSKDVQSFSGQNTNIIAKVLLQYPKCKILHDNLEIGTQTHNGITFQYCQFPFAGQISNKQLLFFFLRSLFQTILLIPYMILGFWVAPVLFSEIILSDYVRRVNKKSIPHIILFDHSKFVFRPLWTYITESEASKTILYFYSTNNESIILDDLVLSRNEKWRLMNYPNYWVWDEYQLSFVKKYAVPPFNGLIVGPILLGSNVLNDNTLFEDNNISISVFDVQPKRDFKYQILAEPFEYYVPEITNAFLEDIVQIAEDFKITILYKGKRNIGRFAHYKYYNLIENLTLKTNFKKISPDESASSLIKKTNAVISFPFTSTALIGRELSRESVYYDPTRLINKSDSAANGIRIISGKDELIEWFSKIKN